MAPDACRAKIFDVIQDTVAASYPGTPVMYENQKFEQPNGAKWVHVALSPNKSVRKNMGGSVRWRHMGVAVINIMVPEDTGTKVMNEVANTLFEALADQNFDLGADGYLKLCFAERRNRGVVNGWYVHNIQVEYHQDVAAS